MNKLLNDLIFVLVLGAGHVFTACAHDERTVKRTQSEGADSSSGNIPPSVAITTPISGALYCLGADIHMMATASDPDGTIAQVQFFFRTTNLVGTVTNPPYSLTLSNGQLGLFSWHYGDPIVLTAVATDNLGASTTSNPVTIFESQGTPCEAFLYVLSPTNDSVLNSPANFTMHALLQSDYGGTGPVQFFANTNLLGTMPTANQILTLSNNPTGTTGWNLLLGTWSWFEFTVTNLPAGNYNLTAAARSGPPATGVSDPVNITVLPANIPPSVTMVAPPTNNPEFTLPANIRLEANAFDRDGAISGVQFYYGFSSIFPPGATNAVSPVLTNAPFVLVLTNVTSLAGYGAFFAVAIDDGGASRTSAPVYVSATTVAMSPTVQLVTPTNGAIFASSATVSVEARLLVSDNNVNPIEFSLGTNFVGSVLDPPYRITLSNLADGTYTISAAVRDLSGNLSRSAESTIVVTTLRLSTSGITGAGQLPLRANGVIPGGTVIMQRSTNLVDWVGFGTNLVTANFVDFVDSEPTNSSAQFYRCLLFP